MGTQEAVFRFGDVEVRERDFRLMKTGEVIPVEPKAFRVLLFLLHNPQKLITKEELLNAVWGSPLGDGGRIGPRKLTLFQLTVSPVDPAF